MQRTVKIVLSQMQVSCLGNLWFRWEMMHLSQRLPSCLVNICNYLSICWLRDTKEEYNTAFVAIRSYRSMKKQIKTLKLFKRSLR